MLLGNDADHADIAALLHLAGRVVPPGHVNTAARSPGSEDMQEYFLAAELADGRGRAVQRGQHDGRERFSDLKFQDGLLLGRGRGVSASGEE